MLIFHLDAEMSAIAHSLKQDGGFTIHLEDYTSFSSILFPLPPLCTTIPFHPVFFFFWCFSPPRPPCEGYLCVCVDGGGRQSLVLDVCKVIVGDEPWTTGET